MANTSAADPPALAETAARLRLAIARTARRMRQEANEGLSPTLTAALATIEQQGPLTPSELASVEHVKRPTATRIVATLERDGLIGRTADPADGRACFLTASPEGKKLLRRVRTRKNAYLSRELAKLPAEDVATLRQAAGILERLLEDGASAK